MWWSMLMSWALAAPVELPAGEDPADWAEVFTLVGLELTDEPAERGVRMEPVGDRWRVEVIGTGREALVAPPHTRSDREDIAQLAASLWAASADPGPLPSLPELPALPDPSVAPPPVVAPAPEPEPAPAPFDPRLHVLVEPTVDQEPVDPFGGVSAISAHAPGHKAVEAIACVHRTHQGCVAPLGLVEGAIVDPHHVAQPSGPSQNRASTM